MMATHTIRFREVWRILDGHVGLDDYPIFDESYRSKLNERIRKEYWLNEIGHETIDIFVWRMDLKMCSIMPRYNRMYLAELQNTDPLDGGTSSSRTRQWATVRPTALTIRIVVELAADLLKVAQLLQILLRPGWRGMLIMRRLFLMQPQRTPTRLTADQIRRRSPKATTITISRLRAYSGEERLR